jgi:hypothetical protein
MRPAGTPPDDLPQVADVHCRRWKAPTDVDRRLESYGLVLKAGRWYVVAGPGPRTYRVDQILEISVREEFAPPGDFDLAGYWRSYQADFYARLYGDEAVVRLAPLAASGLTGAAARALAETGVEEPDGWVRAVLPIESLDHALRTFLRLGADVEVSTRRSCENAWPRRCASWPPGTRFSRGVHTRCGRELSSARHATEAPTYAYLTGAEDLPKGSEFSSQMLSAWAPQGRHRTTAGVIAPGGRCRAGEGRLDDAPYVVSTDLTRRPNRVPEETEPCVLSLSPHR